MVVLAADFVFFSRRLGSGCYVRTPSVIFRFFFVGGVGVGGERKYALSAAAAVAVPAVHLCTCAAEVSQSESVPCTIDLCI